MSLSPCSNSSSPPPIKAQYLEYFGPSQPIFACKKCFTHITLQDELISKSFNGLHGPAYLFRSAINVDVGTKEDRHLLTGLHTIGSLSCKGCKIIIGWKYFKAYDYSQTYKEGKFIIEKQRIVKENAW